MPVSKSRKPFTEHISADGLGRLSILGATVSEWTFVGFAMLESLIYYLVLDPTWY